MSPPGRPKGECRSAQHEGSPVSFALAGRDRRTLIALIAAVVVVRVATLGAYPVMDSTEARYAEVARLMLATGNWITPQAELGVAFWAKPPLSTWLSAGSMALFGVGEFAARLPELLLLLACGIIVFRCAAARAGRDFAFWAVALFATTALVFVAAGGVMTDPALALGTTMSMAGFWRAVDGPERGRRVAGYAFFVGLAIGLLAKGPIAVVLTALPAGVWVLATRRWRTAATRLPWLTGALLTTVLAVPWYWLAETRTPGFLDYFLVGEHWKRFVEKGWKGDLYGAAHSRPRGMIWLLWLAAALPWSIAAVGWLVGTLVRRRDDLRRLVRDPWALYLALWTLAPMVFFTFAGNILITYVLPGLPAFALLVADVWQPGSAAAQRRAVRAVAAAGVGLCVIFVGAVVILRDWETNEHSHKGIVTAYLAQRPSPSSRLVYVAERPLSADFYSRGEVVKLPDVAALRPFLDDGTPDFIVIRDADLPRLAPADRDRLQPIGRSGRYQLMRELPR
jgi:4-amino-4-deoxy-L-arabinose transferase-like glycosyltransferase